LSIHTLTRDSCVMTRILVYVGRHRITGLLMFESLQWNWRYWS